MVSRPRTTGEYRALLAKALQRVNELEEEIEILTRAVTRMAEMIRKVD